MTDNTLPGSEPQIDQFSIERLLTGQPAEPSADPAIQALAGLVSAARTAASPAEMSGEAIAVAAYNRAVSSGIATTRRSRTRRSSMLALSSLLASKVAVAAAVGAVSVGGVSAAAFTGNLPTPVQKIAHDTVGAPAVHHGRPAGTPNGPDATGKAAFGLCTAYTAAQASGGVDPNSVAFQNLATAAGGAANIATYCATIPHPGHSSSSHPSGPPASHPAHPAHPSHPADATESDAADATESEAPEATESHPAGPPASHPAHPSHPASELTTSSAG